LRWYTVVALILCVLNLPGCLQDTYEPSPASTAEKDPDADGPSRGLMSGNPCAALVLRHGDIITLQSDHFSNYLGADGTRPAMAHFPQSWEKWILTKEAPSADDVISSGDRVFLRSLRWDRYLSGNNDTAALALASLEWEVWEITKQTSTCPDAKIRHTDLVGLQSFRWKRYLSADSSKPLLAKELLAWELWSIGRWQIPGPAATTLKETLHYGDIVTLEANYTRNYLSGDGDRKAAQSRYGQAWEQWQVESTTGESAGAAVEFGVPVRLKSLAFGSYLSGTDGGGVNLSPNRLEWEMWTFIDDANAGGREVKLNSAVNLRSFHGKHLSGNLEDGLTQSPNREAWEKWTLNYGEEIDASGLLHFGDMIVLKAEHFRNYAGARGSAPLPRSWEQWRLIKLKDAGSRATVGFEEPILLYSPVFNRYLSGEPDKRTLSLSVNTGAYEKWKIMRDKDDNSNEPLVLGKVVQFRLAEYLHRYLSGAKDYLTIVDNADSWEKWSLRQSWTNPHSWMDKVGDDTPITRLTIPGTHDSATYANLLHAPFTTTQTLDIARQLNAGVRFLDIRVRPEGKRLVVIHGPIDLGKRWQGTSLVLLDLADIVEACRTFLGENPSEAVFMSIKRDDNVKGSIQREFDDQYLALDMLLDPIWHVGTTLPKMGEIRGKIVLMSRTGMDGGRGISLSLGKNGTAIASISGAESLHYEDLYEPHRDDDKILAIKDHLKDAQDYFKNLINSSELWLTFTSANKPGGTDVLDYLSGNFAKGPDYYALEGGIEIKDPIWGTTLVDLSWLNINGWLLNNVAFENGPMGIVAVDFVNDKLAQELIRSSNLPDRRPARR